MGLKEYKAKRDFKRTPEPGPATAASRKRKKAPLFVIQKHAASRLHYDVRFEMDGVLKSWAVPKGIPYKKGEKHLAVHVEDHPFDYKDFEGVIPAGQYGGGTVMVWDTGTYEDLGGDPLRDVEQGKLHFLFHGKKLDGEWTLVRTRRGGDKDEWLLIKTGDDVTPLSAKADDQSALTGRTMDQIANARDAEWISKSSKPKKRPRDYHLPPELPPARPVFVEPMKPRLVDELPATGEWEYELKFDGYRAIAIKDSKPKLMSRNAKELKFPPVADVIDALPCSNAVLDGEIVALDEQGRTSFQLLQAYESNEKHPPIRYYVFDLMTLNGKDLRNLPLSKRRPILEQLLSGADEPIRYSAPLRGEASAILAEIRRVGLEGLIGKKVNSLYESGRRTRSWIKLKCVNEQEFVIGGYTEPQGARKYFGAILVGYYEGSKLMFAAKVGTGFSEKLLRELHQRFQKLVRDECPFVNLPTRRSGRFGQGITRSEMKRCTWLKPELVCQVKFTEWTRDGGLRAPVFLGLRPDKDAREVVREQ
jgi:bifunctional non-homologous end joining protein LigD